MAPEIDEEHERLVEEACSVLPASIVRKHARQTTKERLRELIAGAREQEAHYRRLGFFDEGAPSP